MKFGQFLKGGGSILVKPMPNFQFYETETDTKIQIKNVHYYKNKNKESEGRVEAGQPWHTDIRGHHRAISTSESDQHDIVMILATNATRATRATKAIRPTRPTRATRPCQWLVGVMGFQKVCDGWKHHKVGKGKMPRAMDIANNWRANLKTCDL